MSTTPTSSANRFRFRVWDKVEERFLHHYEFAVDAEGKILFDCGDDGLQYDDTREKQTILMQSTGLTDRLGKEIFEGDVVHFLDVDNGFGHENDKSDEGIGQVKWEESATGRGYTVAFFIRIIENPKYKPFGSIRGLVMSSLEVIGNIYENPELLS